MHIHDSCRCTGQCVVRIALLSLVSDEPTTRQDAESRKNVPGVIEFEYYPAALDFPSPIINSIFPTYKHITLNIKHKPNIPQNTIKMGRKTLFNENSSFTQTKAFSSTARNSSYVIPGVYDLSVEDSNWVLTSSFIIFTMQTGECCCVISSPPAECS